MNIIKWFYFAFIANPEEIEKEKFIQANKELLGEDYAKLFWDKYH